MSDAEPVTQTMKVTEARAHWSQVVEAVHRRQTRVVLERAGIPVAALISTEDLRRLQRYEAERDADFAVIDRMRDAFKDVPDEELKREIEKAVAEVKDEMRANREADFAVLDRISAAFADIPDEELEREINKASAEVRAEMRAEREQAARSA